MMNFQSIEFALEYTYIESWSQLESAVRMRVWKETVSMFPTNLGSYFFAPGEFVM